MTDNQTREFFDKMTKCINGIQRLETGQAELKADISELKADVSDLKSGQERLETQMEIIGKALDSLAGDSVRVKARVEILEERVN